MSYSSPYYGGYGYSRGRYGGSYAAPVYGYGSNYYSQGYAAPVSKGETWSEYIPVEQKYTDYVAEQRIEYKPVERTYTDYIEVQHQREYVPVPRLEKKIEYVPVDRYEEHIDYVPVERSQVVKAPASVSGSRAYLGDSYVAPLRNSYYGTGNFNYGGYRGGYSYAGRPYYPYRY